MVTEANGGAPLEYAQAAGALERCSRMVAARRICFHSGAWHEPRSGPVGIPASSGIMWEHVNNV
jgi:hypothetical protein